MASGLEKLPSLLAEREEVRFAYLFGSRAVGYQRPDSDVDLAVFFDPKASPWARLDLEEGLSRDMKVSVQVISLNESLRPRLLYNILATGVVIKDSQDRGEWEEQARQAIRGREGVTKSNFWIR